MATVRTVQDVIYRALRQLHVIRADETPQTADTSTGLSVLQDMIADWANDGIIVPVATLEYFTLVPNQASYTIGQTGTPTLNTVRPETVLGAYVVDSAGYTHYVELIKEQAYYGIIDKTLTNEFPECVYVAYTSPNLTMYLYPVPDTAYTFYFYSDKPLVEPTALNQDVMVSLLIPRSYHKALADNLTIELAPEYEREPSPLVLNAAIKGKAALKSASASRRINPAKIDIGMAPRKTYSLVDFFGGV